MIELRIPCLPDMSLASNARRSSHWSQQASSTKTEREKAAAMLLEALQRDSAILQPAHRYMISEARWPVAVHWTLHFPKGQRAVDCDNCVSALKSWIDAIVMLDWLPNDSPKYIRTVAVTVYPSSPEGPLMILTIK